MDALTIHLFGDFRVQIDANAPVRFPTRKSKSLLALIALKGDRPVLRTSLAGELWPDVPEERAQRALNTEVWRLRTALRDGGGDPQRILDTRFDTIGLMAKAPIWVDAVAFEQATGNIARLDAQAAADVPFADALADAVGLYRGDLLEGIYDEWCLVHREAYRARLIAVLEALVRIRMDERQWDQAIAYGRQLLSVDPLLEHIHRALMRSQYIRGDRAAALKQYETCVAVLGRELGVGPMDDTRQAYETIMAATPWAPRAVVKDEPPSPPPLASLEEISLASTPADKIDFALSNLHTAKTWLEDANRTLREPASPA